jgi:hypothetical protein
MCKYQKKNSLYKIDIVGKTIVPCTVHGPDTIHLTTWKFGQSKFKGTVSQKVCDIMPMDD